MILADSVGVTGRRRPAGGVVGLYLLATLPLLVASPLNSPGIAAGHLAGTAISLVAFLRREPSHPAMAAIADWLPLLLVPLLYAELPVLMAAGGVAYHDAAVQGMERVLFSSNPSRSLAGALPWQPLSEALHAAYFLYYPLIYIPPAILFVRRQQRAFELVTTGLVAAFAICFTIFIVFPVQGPRYLWLPAGAVSGPIRHLVLNVLEAGSSRGAAFPSSHVAVAVVQSVLAWRLRSSAWWLYALVTAGLAAGAVYGGFHYAVDVAAGALVGLGVAVVAPYLHARLAGRHRARAAG